MLLRCYDFNKTEMINNKSISVYTALDVCDT